jgi:hypothetical protein
MESNYKNKYLKYKNKYLELKFQFGGLLTEDKQFELRTDICASYVTELIGTMDMVINVIKGNFDYINNLVTAGNVIAQEIISNWHDITNIRVFNMDAKNDGHKGKLYKDLFYFNGMDPQGNYIIKSETRKLIFKESKIINSQNLQFFRNTLISLEADEGVHWIYVDNNSLIHNPYNYNMQIDHSHQFCQSHSLLMALLPSMRKTCDTRFNLSITSTENERLCAYKSILNLFSIILYPIIYYVIINDPKLYNDIIRDIKNINLLKKNIENNKFVNDFIQLFNIDSTQNPESNAVRISTGILGVLNTPYALEKAPEFQ